MAEEDSLMNEAVELMNQWKVPADFREFVADCCNFGGGAVDDWVREVDVRRWSLQLLKAAIADGSVFSGEWDSLSCSAVLPVPMPAFMLKNALAFEMEVAARKSEEGGETCYGEGGSVSVSEGGEEKLVEGKGEVKEEVKVEEKQEKEGEAESLSPLSPCWGATLPPPAGLTCEETEANPWRPWEEGGKVGVDVGKLVGEVSKVSHPSSTSCLRRKWRGKAAAARSLGRLLRWQEKLEPQLGPSRLQLELRCATPSVPGRELRRTNLASRFGGGKAEPCLGRVILISMNFRISNFACSHVDPIASLVSEQFLFSLWDVSFPCW